MVSEDLLFIHTSLILELPSFDPYPCSLQDRLVKEGYISGEFVAAVAGGKVIGCGGQGQYGFLGDCHALSSCGEWERQVDGPAKQDAHVTATSTGEVILTGVSGQLA